MDIGFILWLLIPIGVIASSFWVYFDARAIGGDLINENGVFDGRGPGLWFLLCLLLWAWFFPAYLGKRKELKRRVADFRTLPEEYRWK